MGCKYFCKPISALIHLQKYERSVQVSRTCASKMSDSTGTDWNKCAAIAILSKSHSSGYEVFLYQNVWTIFQNSLQSYKFGATRYTSKGNILSYRLNINKLGLHLTQDTNGKMQIWITDLADSSDWGQYGLKAQPNPTKEVERTAQG